MTFEPSGIKDVILIKPKVFKDERGFFAETFRESTFKKNGIVREFVQDNLSSSKRNTLRGLHYQIINPQAKLVMVTQGEILDVAVDIRKNSPTFGESVTARLSSYNKHMLFIPEGFAHGFLVLSETATFLYKCSDYYNPKGERGIRWNDPDMTLPWPDASPVLSEKDKNLPFLKNVQDLPE
ncbi:MAG: dTDP-4-dehydrorhamnose 3,5-epimerase [Balneolales bacterium]